MYVKSSSITWFAFTILLAYRKLFKFNCRKASVVVKYVALNLGHYGYTTLHNSQLYDGDSQLPLKPVCPVISTFFFFQNNLFTNNSPWCIAIYPEIFKIIFIPQSVHWMPETIMLKSRHLILFS